MEEVVGSIPTGSTNPPSRNVPGNSESIANAGFLREFAFRYLPGGLPPPNGGHFASITEPE